MLILIRGLGMLLIHQSEELKVENLEFFKADDWWELDVLSKRNLFNKVVAQRENTHPQNFESFPSYQGLAGT